MAKVKISGLTNHNDALNATKRKSYDKMNAFIKASCGF